MDHVRVAETRSDSDEIYIFGSFPFILRRLFFEENTQGLLALLGLQRTLEGLCVDHKFECENNIRLVFQ